MRSISSRVRWALGILLFIAGYPVVQEFFIELAREQGAYEKPTQRVRGVMTFLSELAQDWVYQLAVVFLAGVFLGTMLDWLARQFDRRRADRRAPTVPVVSADEARSIGLAALDVAARL